MHVLMQARRCELSHELDVLLLLCLRAWCTWAVLGGLHSTAMHQCCCISAVLGMWIAVAHVCAGVCHCNVYVQVLIHLHLQQHVQGSVPGLVDAINTAEAMTDELQVVATDSKGMNGFIWQVLPQHAPAVYDCLMLRSCSKISHQIGHQPMHIVSLND
jgi:hypothetical protein